MKKLIGLVLFYYDFQISKLLIAISNFEFSDFEF